MSFRARRFSLLFNYFCHGFGVTINALQWVRASCWGLQDNGRGTLSDAGARRGPGVAKGKRCGLEREQGAAWASPSLRSGDGGRIRGRRRLMQARLAPQDPVAQLDRASAF